MFLQFFDNLINYGLFKIVPLNLAYFNNFSVPFQGCSQKFLAQTVSFSKLKAKGLYDVLKACPTQLGVFWILALKYP